MTLPRMILDEAAGAQAVTLERLRGILIDRLGPGADVRVVDGSVVVGGRFGDEYGGKPFVVAAAQEAAKGAGREP